MLMMKQTAHQRATKKIAKPSGVLKKASIVLDCNWHLLGVAFGLRGSAAQPD